MTDEQILNFADEVYDEAVSIRRKIHENPELGNMEVETTKLIVSLLESWGIEVLRPLETGAVGVLNCGKGKTVALRADIDALAVTEQTGLSYASKVCGKMHACGHDIHTASLLAAAKILSEHKDKFHGTVVFVFQPDEEGNGGAQRIIDTGIFDRLGVEKVFGIHIRPETAAGKVAVKYGKSYAASDIFKITLTGKSSHGAEPEKGINALTAASHLVCALDGAVSRMTAPTDSAVLSVCTFESGTAVNIIPESAVLTGIIRTLGAKTRKEMKEKLVNTAQAVAQAFGCKAQIDIKESYPGVVNCDKETKLVENCAVSLLGRENVEILTEPTMTTEDFGYYLDKADGCFYHIGAGTQYPLHNGKMSPDETCIKTAAAMHIKLVFEVLGN
ncbi:MAG: M20 family metallopeptidase [Acutalibacteraceae bacterium]